MPPGEQIDAITVGVGLDLRRVKGDLGKIQTEVNAHTRAAQPVHVPVQIGYTKTSALRGDLRRLTTQIGKEAARQDQHVIVPVHLQVDRNDFRNFRRDLEQRLKSNTGGAGAGIHVPIKVADIGAFRKEIETGVGVIAVKTKWAGWDGDGPPASGGRGRGGGGGGGAPHSGTPPPTGPAPATSRPARTRAQNAPPPPASPATGARQSSRTQQQAQAEYAAYEQQQRQEAINRYQSPAQQAARPAPRPAPAQQAARPAARPAQAPAPAAPAPAKVVQSYDRHTRSWVTRTLDSEGNQVGDANYDGTREDALRSQQFMQQQLPQAPRAPRAPAGPRPPTREEQRAARRANVRAGRSPQPARQAPARKITDLPDAMGDRVSVDTLRFSRPQEVLEGKDRAEYIGQQRASGKNVGARPAEDSAPRWTPGSGFRVSPSRAATSQRPATGPEAIAQSERAKAVAAWKSSDAYKKLPRHEDGTLDVGAMAGFGPEFQRAFEAASDPESSFTMEDVRGLLQTVTAENQRLFGTAGREGTGKRGYKQARRARKIRGGRTSTDRVGDVALVTDAALAATSEQARIAVDPLRVNKTGDNKGRGKGGKPGKIGGRSAGTLASESTDLDAVNEIVRRRGIGGKDNGWKTLTGQYDKADISRARAIINANAPQSEGPAGNPEEGGAAYYAAGEAPSIPGGQGMTRSNPDIGAETRSREANKQAQKAEDELGRAPRSGPVSPGTPLGRETGAGFGRTADYGAAGRPRTSRPPQNMGGGPTPRSKVDYEARDRQQREYEERRQKEFREKYRDAYQRHQEGTAGNLSYDPRASGRRINALMSMAKAEESPNEAELARQALRRYGVQGFAEGGVDRQGIDWRALKAFTHVDILPRPGSRARQEIESKYLRGMREREKRAKKPKYQQGGSSDPVWAKNRQAQLSRQPWCASCGKQTDLTVDHKLDTASGGTHDMSNLQTLCRSCNGRKSGGRSAREVATPYAKYAPGADPWGTERMSYEDELNAFRERSLPEHRAEGGLSFNKSFRQFPQGFQDSAARHFGGLVDKYGVPVKLSSMGRVHRRLMDAATVAHTTGGGSIAFNPAEVRPGAKGEWPFVFAHEYGHAVDDRLSARGRNRWARKNLGTQDPEEFADAFANAHLSGKDPHGILDFVGSAKRTHLPVLLNRAIRDIPHYAEGGLSRRLREGPPTRMTSNGIPERAAQDPSRFNIRVVGERGPEAEVTDKGTGQSHIIPAHKLPMWLARAQSGKGLAKDMTGYAEGGALGIRNMGRGGQRYTAGGSLVSEAAARTGPVTRVFVVNWPAGAQMPGMGNIHQNPAQARAASPNAAGAAAAGAGAPPPLAPNGAPAPGAAGPRIRLNPLTRVEARRAGIASTEDIEARLQRVSSGIAETLQEAPVRALSVAFGQIAQTAIGGRGDILARAGVARRLAGGARREQGELTRLETTRRELAMQTRDLRAGPQTKQNTEKIAENLEQLRQLGPAIIRQRQVTEQRTTRAEQAQGQILTRGQQVRAQSVGLGGIIAGTQLFSVAVAALSGAEQAASAALGPLVDQMLGWPAAIDKVTASVRDNIQASSGNVRQGTALALAGSGVSAKFLDQQGGNVSAIGTSRAAQAAAQQALDITRAAAGRTNDGNKGLYEGTGGLFGSNVATDVFGGQEGFLQTIEKRLDVNSPKTASANRNTESLRSNGGVIGMPAWMQNGGTIPSEEEVNKQYDAQAQVIEDLNKGLKSAADYAGQAGQEFKLVTDATKDQTDAMIKSAEATHDDAAVTRAKGFADKGVTILGPGGRALQGKEFQDYAQQQARGQLIQDPQLILRQTDNERRAQAAMLKVTSQNTRQQDIPAQFALENIASPLPSFGSTFSTKGADKDTPYGKETLANVEKYRKMADDANKQVTAGIDEGRKAMTDLVGQAGPEALQNFNSLIDQIGSLGSKIQGITEGISMRQVNLEVKQYDEQIRITTRSLGDARDLWAAIQGNAKGTVGGLQGQNIMLERQNQLLGRRATALSFKSADIGFKSSDLQQQLQQIQFNQSQRQINFGVAVAGFTAPGSTPEERAARIDEAKLEAAEAQKQLDLQVRIAKMAREQLSIARQQLGLAKQQNTIGNKEQDNQFKITVEEAKRSIGDLEHQLGLLKESRSITIDSSAAEATIARLQKVQGKLVAQAQSYVQEGQQIRNNVIDDTGKLIAATGKAWNQVETYAETAWTTFFKGYEPALKMFLSGGTPQNAQEGNDSRHGGAHNAAGTIHTTSGAERFTAGEAGTEQVIVIRNPKMGMMSSGGMGGGGTVVNFGGLTINLTSSGKNDTDARMIATLAEERISRRLSMLAG